ncbi:ABC-2 type transport system permease protein [Stackebrandtia endophytica]|uniref:Transport permease protein n=1 Tax=Stackebrandtia endophytica TaxID=1496996 RepID=A0A543AWH4_9ACTN|nr:ABC transporter permease [Stackebrandtia endophytica]TQL76923.1 ABC-2 type transport system permease protein [Stackebrandtia endophytica]
MSAVLRLTVTETRLFFREPLNLVFALAIPPILLIVLGLVPGFGEPEAGLGGLRVIDIYTPVVVGMIITTLALTSLPLLLATYREKGVLRRMRTTPIRPTAMIAAQLLMSTAISAVVMVVVLAIARLGFDVGLPQHLPAYLLVFLLAALAMFSIGLLVAALAPGGAGASAIGLVLFFPMLFFAGLWVPRASMNEVLLTISDLTPLGAAVQSLQDAALGDWPQLLHVAVMLVWAIAAGGLAARFFRWE